MTQQQILQTNEQSEQNVYAIISNYLSSMNEHDIQKLCEQFGKNMVKSVLVDKYKKLNGVINDY